MFFHFFIILQKMKGGTLRYYAPETLKQLERGLSGILRNFNCIISFAGGAVDKMQQAGINNGKTKLLDYASGEMVDQLERQKQQGSGMKGAKRKRKTPRRRADIFTYK